MVLTAYNVFFDIGLSALVLFAGYKLVRKILTAPPPTEVIYPNPSMSGSRWGRRRSVTFSEEAMPSDADYVPCPAHPKNLVGMTEERGVFQPCPDCERGR